MLDNTTDIRRRHGLSDVPPAEIRDAFAALARATSLVVQADSDLGASFADVQAWIEAGCRISRRLYEPTIEARPSWTAGEAVAALRYTVHAVHQPTTALGGARRCLTVLYALLPADTPELVRAMLCWNWGSIGRNSSGSLGRLVAARARWVCEGCGVPEPEIRWKPTALLEEDVGADIGTSSGTGQAALDLLCRVRLSDLVYLCGACRGSRGVAAHNYWFTRLPDELRGGIIPRLAATGRWPLRPREHASAVRVPEDAWSTELHRRAGRDGLPVFGAGRKHTRSVEPVPGPGQYGCLFRAVALAAPEGEAGRAAQARCQEALAWVESGCVVPWGHKAGDRDQASLGRDIGRRFARALDSAEIAAARRQEPDAARVAAWFALACVHDLVPARTPDLVQAVLAWNGLDGRICRGALRALVKCRAGNRCEVCGDTDGSMTVDHLLAWALGGRTHASNLMCLCLPCGERKGSLPVEEWLGRLGADRGRIVEWLAATGRWPPEEPMGLGGAAVGEEARATSIR
jgi:hypothetical protein